MTKNFLIYFFKTKKILNNIHIEKKIIFLKKNKIKILLFWIKIFFKLFNFFKNKKVIIFKNILFETFLNYNDNDNFKINLKKNKNNFIFLKLLKKNFKNYNLKLLPYKNNYTYNIFYNFLLNFFKYKKKFIYDFKTLKKKFLIFKKFKWLYLYWNSIIYKKHLIVNSKSRDYLRIRRYWHVFEIEDEVTRFRLKIDDGIGNDWVYFIRFSKIKSLIKLKKKLIFYRLSGKKKKNKNKLRIKAEKGVLKKKKIQLKRTEIFNKKKDSAILINKIRQQKIIELRDEIYYKVTGKRFFSIFKKKDFFFFLKNNNNFFLNYNIFLKNWKVYFFNNFILKNFLIFLKLKKKKKIIKKKKKKIFFKNYKKKN